MSLVLVFSVFIYANSYDEALKEFNKKNYTKALQLLHKAEKNGNKSAFYSLGYMYYYGYGTSKDYKKAYEWFIKDQKNGSIKSCSYLGYMCGNGQGTLQNDKKAIYYYELGAKNNDADSICDLAEYYINGWGVQKNYFKAIELVKKGYQLGGNYCKSVWDKYNLASKKTKEQLDYNTEKLLCQQNFKINPSIAIEHCEYAIQLKPIDNISRVFLGLAYFRLGQLQESLKQYNYLEQQLLDNTTMLLIFTQKGNVLMQQQKNDKALKYFNKALQLLQKITNKKLITKYKANIYNGIGSTEMQKENYEKALKYLNKALMLANQKQMKMTIANNIGTVYFNQELYKDSIDSLILALNLANDINDNIQRDLIQSNLAMAYLLYNNVKKAKYLAKQSIEGAQKTNNKMALFNSYLVYSAVMEEIGNKKKSDIYYKKANAIGNQIGISFEDEETKTNLSPLNILKNMFKKRKK